ncbi:hypothetical protein P8891_11580 [Bacillus atrophaeus]|uniref:beta barrel domain-containing protein n=1 Tax=Bacillus atrophaeus TaxID=1452 RepID=UPI0022810439|nr:hypothetical protein [Bacillus atrophaeus]MCY7947663.1 hypothetical protein [Bacillus atrophaeus]MCY9167765.1 hypothetical protein [Bacillus atrophaeus]MEC0741703.1 hypothetical protein [Bacillus atrophaeus]MEC0744982.1 hypothetical protein [Bacillus atrophaeus]MEC0757973.1 hypothetical protein [Bacillus atrophaeus]
MTEKLQVGQTVYLKPDGNQSRYTSEINVAKIIKVGRKYFEVSFNGSNKLKFLMSDLTQAIDYPDWKLYFSEQEISDEEEHEKLLFKIKSAINRANSNKYSLEQLRAIYEIMQNK